VEVAADVGVPVARLVGEIKGATASVGGGVTTIGFGSSSSSTSGLPGVAASAVAAVALSTGLVRRKPVDASAVATGASSSAGPVQSLPQAGGSPESTAAVVSATAAALAGTKRVRLSPELARTTDSTAESAGGGVPADELPSEPKAVKVE
jgi:hypothetical protein